MLTQSLEFRPENDAAFFAALPSRGAVFVLRGEAGEEPYVSKTSNLRRRMQRLLGAPEGPSKRLNLRDRVRSVQFAPVASDFEAGFVLYRTLRDEFPTKYADRLKLRFAPLLKFLVENPYPRVAVTTRIQSLRSKSLYYGPFVSRVAAEKFANDSLDFFKLRRCVEELSPDPAFPGCIYSEMKMCLAPCFRGCTDEQYAAETEQVRHFLDTGGMSLVREIGTLRDTASESLEFERAAELHARLEKVKAVVGQAPEILRRLDRLDGVLVLPATEADSVTLFKVKAGFLCDPASFPVSPRPQVGSVKTPQSMEARLSEALAAIPECKPSSAYEWMEHLALLKRWYYRSSKTGELFLTEENGELPYRRLVRGISRVFKGEKPKGELNETAGDYWRFRAKEAGIPDEHSSHPLAGADE